MMERIRSEFEKRGYTFIGHIQENSRFGAVKLEKEGTFYFGKYCVNPTLDTELENEIWYNLLVSKLTDASPEMIVRVPKIFEFGFGWYVCEYWDYPILVDSKTSIDRNAISLLIDEMASLLSELDISTQLSHLEFSQISITESALFNNLLRKVDSWMEQPLQKGLITNEEVEQAKDVIIRYAPYAQFALQHGDFVPWHMFRLPEGKIGLVDSEHASIAKPRFYDLAYCYTRMYTFAHAPAQAGLLLRKFVEKKNISLAVFEKAFMPVITLRSLGMIIDSLNDESRNDYKNEARELIEKCYEEGVRAFLN